jgi:tRNA nucleotidyltransferase/poly(A) polymerase
VEALPHDIREILAEVRRAGGSAWVVGGCVRDAASGLTPREVDVSTTLLPERVMQVFPDAKDTGAAFGTVTVQRCVLRDAAPEVPLRRAYA